MSFTQLRDERVGCESGLPDSKTTKFCPLSMRHSKIHIALGLGEQPLGPHHDHSPFTVYLLFTECVFGVLSNAEIQEMCMLFRNSVC